jgi:hypothetical protein
MWRHANVVTLANGRMACTFSLTDQSWESLGVLEASVRRAKTRNATTYEETADLFGSLKMTDAISLVGISLVYFLI